MLTVKLLMHWTIKSSIIDQCFNLFRASVCEELEMAPTIEPEVQKNPSVSYKPFCNDVSKHPRFYSCCYFIV